MKILTKEIARVPTKSARMKGTRMLRDFFVIIPNNAIRRKAPAVIKKLTPTVCMKSVELELTERTTKNTEESRTPIANA